MESYTLLAAGERILEGDQIMRYPAEWITIRGIDITPLEISVKRPLVRRETDPPVRRVVQ